MAVIAIDDGVAQVLAQSEDLRRQLVDQKRRSALTPGRLPEAGEPERPVAPDRNNMACGFATSLLALADTLNERVQQGYSFAEAALEIAHLAADLYAVAQALGDFPDGQHTPRIILDERAQAAAEFTTKAKTSLAKMISPDSNPGANQGFSPKIERIVAGMPPEDQELWANAAVIRPSTVSLGGQIGSGTLGMSGLTGLDAVLTPEILKVAEDEVSRASRRVAFAKSRRATDPVQIREYQREIQGSFGPPAQIHFVTADRVGDVVNPDGDRVESPKGPGVPGSIWPEMFHFGPPQPIDRSFRRMLDLMSHHPPEAFGISGSMLPALNQKNRKEA